VATSGREPARLWPRGLVLLGTLTVVLTGEDAAASPLFELSGDQSGGQGGLQGRTVEGGASSAYFNPALLTEAEAGLTVGFLTLGTDINISYAARPSPRFDVPNYGSTPPSYPGGAAIPFVPLGTGVLQNGIPASGPNPAVPAKPRGMQGTGHQTNTYEAIGLVVKLFKERLTLGVYGLIPNGKFTNLSAFYPDEREQYFSNSLHPELYGDRLTAVSFAFALGFKINDQLSIGVGTTLSLNVNAQTPAFVASASDLSHLLIDSDINVAAGLAPHFGLSYNPHPKWRLTATAHAPSSLSFTDTFTFTLAGGQGAKSTITFVHDYMPWRFGVGTSYDLVKEPHDSLTVAATAVLGLWSTYQNRDGETPDPAYGWYNTISPTAGVRHQHDDVGLFLDTQYTPTPVPPQTGRTNYVDNDRVGGDIGIDYTFQLFGTKMRLGANFEAQRLIPRTQAKIPTPNEPDGLDHYPSLVHDEVPDNATAPNAQGAPAPVGGAGRGLQTNNPGWPGFGSEGWVLGGGLTLSVIP
jgi:hypothetical protein